MSATPSVARLRGASPTGVTGLLLAWLALASLSAACGQSGGADAVPNPAGAADTVSGADGADSANLADGAEVAGDPDTGQSGGDADAPTGDDSVADGGDDSIDLEAGTDAGGLDGAVGAPIACESVDDCPQGGACQVATCSKKGHCGFEPGPDGIACNDGNACTTVETCLQGACVASAKLDCNDDNACTTDKCNPLAGCVNLALGASATCDDGDACTVDDFCLQGDCQAGVNTCQCKTQQDCGKFEDGDACNGTFYCDKAAGAPYTCKVNPATIVTCSPAKNSDCQTNTCVPSTGTCQLVTAGENTTCEDGDTCTAGDYCEQGICHSGTATCNCKSDADCAASEDGNACNGTLFCNKAKSQCQLNPVTVVTCKTVFDDSCQANQCNPKLGTCHLLPIHQAGLIQSPQPQACPAGHAFVRPL